MREVRVFTEQLEARGEADDGTLRLVGYAATWDRWYRVTDQRGTYDERMAPGSWRRTLSRKQDIRFLENHQGVPYGRTKSGTLTLTADDVGLLADAKLDPRQQRARDLYAAVERGDVDQMSVAFEVLQQKWSDDRSQRTINEVRGYDVSVVTYPANEETLVVAGRSDDLDSVERAVEPVTAGMSLRMAMALASQL